MLEHEKGQFDALNSVGELDFSEGDFDVPFEDRELADVFDRYSTALDSGDHEAAEKILAAHPEIGEDFRLPLRGLYLLGCEARQRKADEAANDSSVEKKRLGDFELGPELGRGGMGIVYSARQISLQRDVALKILPFTAVLDPRQVARFQNEAQAAASLHHPNIVPVYGVGCERGVHYYSMQMIVGQTMAQLINQLQETRAGSPTDATAVGTGNENISSLSTIASIQSRGFVRNVVQAGVKIAEAIHYAHEHGIVHRDIKPSNLLLDQSGTPWVADFGLARGRGSSNLTSQGDQIGTLRYMSPEQAAGRNHQVDFRTDVYSLGITLYELLTLQPAFSENDRMKLLTSIQNDQPKPMRQINASVPVDLETIIYKAIDKNPLQRYQSADDFAADMNRFLEGRAIQAKRKTSGERLFDVISKNRRLAAVVASGLVLATVGAITIASVFYHQRDRERQATAESRFYLQQANKAVERFGAQTSDELLAVPGTEELRAGLLSESISYYRDFISYADDRDGLEFELAQAYSQLAGLYERAGDDDQARTEYEAGISVLEQLTQIDAQLEEAVCINRLGLLQQRAGELGQASRSFELAIEKLSELDDVDSATVPHALAIANLAMLDYAKGKTDSAGKRFQQALAKLPAERSGDEAIVARNKVANSYVALLGETDPAQAVAFLKVAIKSLKETNSRLREHGSSPQLIDENMIHLADMRNNLAILYSRTGNYDEARKLARQAIDFWQSFRTRFPARLDSIQRLATAFNTMGEIQWRSKASGSGDQLFAKSESLYNEAMKKSQRQVEIYSRLAGVLHNRSLVAFQMGNAQTAVQRIEKAIELQTHAAESAPLNKRYRHLLQSHYVAQTAFLKPSSSVTANLEAAQ